MQAGGQSYLLARIHISNRSMCLIDQVAEARIAEAIGRASSTTCLARANCSSSTTTATYRLFKNTAAKLLTAEAALVVPMFDPLAHRENCVFG